MQYIPTTRSIPDGSLIHSWEAFEKLWCHAVTLDQSNKYQYGFFNNLSLPFFTPLCTVLTILPTIFLKYVTWPARYFHPFQNSDLFFQSVFSHIPVLKNLLQLIAFRLKSSVRDKREMKKTVSNFIRIHVAQRIHNRVIRQTREIHCAAILQYWVPHCTTESSAQKKLRDWQRIAKEACIWWNLVGPCRGPPKNNHESKGSVISEQLFDRSSSWKTRPMMSETEIRCWVKGGKEKRGKEEKRQLGGPCFSSIRRYFLADGRKVICRPGRNTETKRVLRPRTRNPWIRSVPENSLRRMYSEKLGQVEFVGG